MSGGGLSLLADLTRRDRAAVGGRESTTFRAQRGTNSPVIRVYDATGNVIETHEHKGDFKEW
jgi:hypothetical protein